MAFLQTGVPYRRRGRIPPVYIVFRADWGSNSDPAKCQSIVSLQDHLSEQQQSQATVVYQELTSGASPTIHLQSGEKASGPLHSRANTASPRLGTRCSICSSRIWKWSQSSGSRRSAEVSVCMQWRKWSSICLCNIVHSACQVLLGSK